MSDGVDTDIMRGKLVAALGIDDDGRTPLGEYVDALVDDRRRLRVQHDGMVRDMRSCFALLDYLAEHAVSGNLQREARGAVMRLRPWVELSDRPAEDSATRLRALGLLPTDATDDVWAGLGQRVNGGPAQ